MSFTTFTPKHEAVMNAIENRGDQWFNDKDLLGDLLPNPGICIEGTSMVERTVAAARRVGQKLVRRSRAASFQRHIPELLDHLVEQGDLERTTESTYGDVHIFSRADAANYGGGTIYRVPPQPAEANPAA